MCSIFYQTTMAEDQEFINYSFSIFIYFYIFIYYYYYYYYYYCYYYYYLLFIDWMRKPYQLLNVDVDVDVDFNNFFYNSEQLL